MTQFAPIIAVALQAVAVGTNIYMASQARKGLDLPKTPTFNIPAEDLQAVNAQIAQNTQLSDQSRAAAQQAIAGYSRGQLSSAYAGQYQQLVQQQLAQVKQQLASQGFAEGSSQYNNAMQSFQLWAGNLKSQLLQSQLKDGMSMAGISDTAINDYLQKWNTQSGVTSGTGNSIYQSGITQLMGANLATTQNQAMGKAIGGGLTGIAGLLDNQKGGSIFGTGGPVSSKSSSSSTALQEYNPGGGGGDESSLVGMFR